MSLTKIFITFIIIAIAFGGFFLYQFLQAQTPDGAVKIKDKTFNITVATTSAQLQTGLSDRNSLNKNNGMLFIFNEPGRYPFWMKDMQFPLDIIFIRENTVVSVVANAQNPEENTKEENFKIYQPTTDYDKVLEINAGIAEESTIKAGDKIILDLKTPLTEEPQQ